MTTYVTYYRVSTAKQGLGLDAQKTICEQYASSVGGDIIGSYSERESGKRDDRPQLAAAIKECQQSGATLLVAKLDRLTRDVVFGFALRRAGVEFTACDAPELNTMMLGVMLSLAQQERELISTRTRQALAELRRNGKQLGTPRNLTADARAKGCAARAAKAAADPANVKAAALAKALIDGGKCVADVVRQLNASGYVTPRGKQWTQAGVTRLLARA